MAAARLRQYSSPPKDGDKRGPDSPPPVNDNVAQDFGLCVSLHTPSSPDSSEESGTEAYSNGRNARQRTNSQTPGKHRDPYEHYSVLKADYDKLEENYTINVARLSSTEEKYKALKEAHESLQAQCIRIEEELKHSQQSVEKWIAKAQKQSGDQDSMVEVASPPRFRFAALPRKLGNKTVPEGRSPVKIKEAIKKLNAESAKIEKQLEHSRKSFEIGTETPEKRAAMSTPSKKESNSNRVSQEDELEKTRKSVKNWKRKCERMERLLTSMCDENTELTRAKRQVESVDGEEEAITILRGELRAAKARNKCLLELNEQIKAVKRTEERQESTDDKEETIRSLRAQLKKADDANKELLRLDTQLAEVDTEKAILELQANKAEALFEHVCLLKSKLAASEETALSLRDKNRSLEEEVGFLLAKDRQENKKRQHDEVTPSAGSEGAKPKKPKCTSRKQYSGSKEYFNEMDDLTEELSLVYEPKLPNLSEQSKLSSQTKTQVVSGSDESGSSDFCIEVDEGTEGAGTDLHNRWKAKCQKMEAEHRGHIERLADGMIGLYRQKIYAEAGLTRR